MQQYGLPTNSVTRIGDRAFDACDRLTAITVEALNSSYSSVEGVLFDQSQTTLIRCPEGKAGSYIVPNSVTSIAEYTFASCNRLTSITIGNNVTSLGMFAFASCSSLTNAPLPGGVTSIGSLAFSRCTNLTSLSIPDTVTNLGDYAFEICPNLKSVSIGNGVTSLGNGAFSFCVNLARLTMNNSLTNLGIDTFEYLPQPHRPLNPRQRQLALWCWAPPELILSSTRLR